MPIYEYQCEDCGSRTEAIQRFGDEPLATCPSCGGPVAKLMSAPAFQFKGTGWYVTDYADKNKKAETQTKSKDNGKDAASGGDSESSAGSSDAGASDVKSSGSGSDKSGASSSSDSSQR